MGGKSKPATTKVNETQTTNQTQTATPYAPAQPMLDELLKAAQTAYAATPKTGTYVAPNADQLAAVSSARDWAGTIGEGAGLLQDLGEKQAAGYFLDIANNPYIKQYMDAATRPLEKQLDSRILNVGDAAKLAGAYGGDRGDLLKAEALTGFNEAALDTRNKIGFDTYMAERQLQQNSGNILGQAATLGFMPSQALMGIGDTQRGWATQEAANAIDAPWAGLDRYMQVLNSVTPYTSQNLQGTVNTQGTTTQTGARPSGAQAGLSGALGGASAGASFGPWGAGIGAVLGGLGGLFG